MSGWVTLQKKVSDLETELADAFRLPPHSELGHKTLRSVQKSLVYVSNLLSAEPDDQLGEIREKLTSLEAAFHCLSEYRTYALQSLLDDAPTSICSRCIRSYLEDPVKAEDDDDDGDEDSRRRSWGLCGAFRSGVMVGVVGCYIAVNYSSFIMLAYPDIYFLPPT